MSTRVSKFIIAIIGFVGVVALMASFSINPAPPAGDSIAQIMVWGKAHENLILVGSWLQAIGSLLNVIFILAIVQMAGGLQRLMGLITAFAAIVIMGVSLVEVSFYLCAIQGGVSGDRTTLMVSLNLIKAIQHAYVLAPAPALMISLGIIILTTRVFSRPFGYIALALGSIMGILSVIGLFAPLQDVIDIVLSIQELWFIALTIALALAARKASDSTSAQPALVAH